MDTLIKQFIPVLRAEWDRQNRKRQQESWSHLARAHQKIPPGDWLIWLILAGRGFGKTRMGAQTICQWAEEGYGRMALIGQTQAQVRQVMVEGQSGILKATGHEQRPVYAPSKQQLTWPNGALAHTFSAENVDQLRGPQFDAAWIDEFAKFPNPQDVLDQLMFGLRLGTRPRILITTTPRSLPLLRQMCDRSDCVVTRGSTFDTEANLSQAYIKAVADKYGETALGRQELYGHMVAETQSLWRGDDIIYVPPLDRPHFTPDQVRKRLVSLVMGLDPAISAHDSSDETGIVIAGRDGEGRYYVVEDASLRAPVEQWTHLVARLAQRWQVDHVVAEVNQGGDMVASLLRAAQVRCPVVSVRATTAKEVRALPVSLYYRQGRVSHARPFHVLEEQMMNFSEGATSSPDRVDALVWALSHLTQTSSASPCRVWG